MKHFLVIFDTNTDSHLDLPVVSHNLERLNSVELAPFKALLDKKNWWRNGRAFIRANFRKKKGIPCLLFLMKSLPICSKHLSIQRSNHHRRSEYECNSKEIFARRNRFASLQKEMTLCFFSRCSQRKNLDKICL